LTDLRPARPDVDFSTLARKIRAISDSLRRNLGGVSVTEDQVATPGAYAAIYSSASGDAKGGDLYYFSVCAYDTLTRIAVADFAGSR
jgi:hypothetical protein